MKKSSSNTVEINTIWFFAITGEMVLNIKTGLVNRQGSPFAQFKKVFKDCPKDKNKAMLYVGELVENNKGNVNEHEIGLRVSPTVQKYIAELKEKQA